jgi:hypothetical protein
MNNNNSNSSNNNSACNSHLNAEEMCLVREIAKDVGEIKTTLAVNTQSLTYHIKRTDLLEDDLRASKRFQYLFLGGVSVVSVVMPILVPLLLRGG